MHRRAQAKAIILNPKAASIVVLMAMWEIAGLAIALHVGGKFLF